MCIAVYWNITNQKKFETYFKKQSLPGEGGALSLQVLSQGLLDFAQEVREPLKGPLHPLDVQHVHDQGRLGHLLHQGQELCADAGRDRDKERHQGGNISHGLLGVQYLLQTRYKTLLIPEGKC